MDNQKTDLHSTTMSENDHFQSQKMLAHSHFGDQIQYGSPLSQDAQPQPQSHPQLHPQSQPNPFQYIQPHSYSQQYPHPYYPQQLPYPLPYTPFLGYQPQSQPQPQPPYYPQRMNPSNKQKKKGCIKGKLCMETNCSFEHNCWYGDNCTDKVCIYIHNEKQKNKRNESIKKNQLQTKTGKTQTDKNVKNDIENQRGENQRGEDQRGEKQNVEKQNVEKHENRPSRVEQNVGKHENRSSVELSDNKNWKLVDDSKKKSPHIPIHNIEIETIDDHVNSALTSIFLNSITNTEYIDIILRLEYSAHNFAFERLERQLMCYTTNNIDEKSEKYQKTKYVLDTMHKFRSEKLTIRLLSLCK